MTQRGDVVGIPLDQEGFRDRGGVLDGLGRDEVADVVPADAFGGGNGIKNELRIASTAAWVGITLSSSSVRSIDSVTSVIFMALIALLASTRKRSRCTDGLFATGLFERRYVFESADRQTQVEFSQERA